MELLALFFSAKQLYLLYLIGVMISVGIIKEKNLFGGIYTTLLSKIKSKKMLVAIFSALAGILPIPGRIVVSAGVLDTIAPKDKKHRSRFGLISYLCTHHYYLWSPLEATLIIPIAALGISYMQMLGFMVPLLAGYLLYLIWYLAVVVEEKDIHIEHTLHRKPTSLIYLPLLAGIGSLIYGLPAWYVFPGVALCYIIGTKTFNIKKIVSYINWKMVLILASIIVASTFLEQNADHYIAKCKPALDSCSSAGVKGFLLVSVTALGLSFALGSSAKFAGIVALLTSLYGIQYLTYFMALEFAGYLISPAHRCVAIAKEYFGTSMGEFIQILGGLVLLILFIGIATLL